MTISVCIVDDNKDIRSALEQIILMADGYTLAGSYCDAEEALQKIPGARPNIVLMDINLGDGYNGIDCVRQLKPQHPDILFMMCTVYEEDEKIFEALKAGANGYILKKTAPGKLLDALRELYEGGAPMSSQIARKVVNAFQVRATADNTREDDNSDTSAAAAPPKTISILSNRENEILELLARGMLYKEIAARLYISQETVRKHVYHIYEKLHVNNRVEAINKFYGR